MAVGSIALPNRTLPTRFRRGMILGVRFLCERFQQAKRIRPIDEKQAWHVLSYALKLDEAWPTVRELLFVMVPQMEQAGHRDDWIVYLERGIEQSKKLGDVEAEAELRFHIGVLYERLAKYDEARRQFESSAAHCEQLGNAHHQARAWISLANVMRRQRHLDEAKRLVESAQELLGEEKAEQAHSHLVLGLIAFDQRKWPEAYDFLSKSLALWEEVKNQRMMAWGLTNLGTALWALKKYDDAIASYKKAIDLFEIIQDPVHQAIARMNLGNVYMARDRFELALELYLLAQPTFHTTQDKLRLAMVNNNKGMAYQKQQQSDKAKQAYRSSIELWLLIGNIKSLVNSMDSLGTVYLEQQLYDKAIATFQDALNWLAQIKNDPSYDYLFDMVATHLRDAYEQQTP